MRNSWPSQSFAQLTLGLIVKKNHIAFLGGCGLVRRGEQQAMHVINKWVFIPVLTYKSFDFLNVSMECNKFSHNSCTKLIHFYVNFRIYSDNVLYMMSIIFLALKKYKTVFYQSISSFLNDPSIPNNSAWSFGLPGLSFSSVLYLSRAWLQYKSWRQLF